MYNDFTTDEIEIITHLHTTTEIAFIGNGFNHDSVTPDGDFSGKREDEANGWYTGKNASGTLSTPNHRVSHVAVLNLIMYGLVEVIITPIGGVLVNHNKLALTEYGAALAPYIVGGLTNSKSATTALANGVDPAHIVPALTTAYGDNTKAVSVPAKYPTPVPSSTSPSDRDLPFDDRFPMSRCVTTPGSANDYDSRRYIIDTTDDAIFLGNSYNNRSTTITRRFDTVKLIDYYVTGNNDAPGTVTVRHLPKKGHPELDGYRTPSEIEYAHS